MRKIIIATVLVFLLGVLAFGVIELGHHQHYKEIEAGGNLRAEITSLTIHGVAGYEVAGTAEIKNTGSESWGSQEHYFALGVFERNPVGKRVEKVLFNNGTNRIVVPGEISANKPWKVDFVVGLPRSGKFDLHFQMVQEGISWFGQEKTAFVVVRE